MTSEAGSESYTYHDVYCNAPGCGWRGQGYVGAERAKAALDDHWEDWHLSRGRITPSAIAGSV